MYMCPVDQRFEIDSIYRRVDVDQRFEIEMSVDNLKSLSVHTSFDTSSDFCSYQSEPCATCILGSIY